jgi:hypothetical protein
MVSKILVVAILLGAFASARADQAPVPPPVLLIEKGTVKIQNGSQTRIGKQGELLREHDCVYVVDRGSASINWIDGTKVVLDTDNSDNSDDRGRYGIYRTHEVGFYGRHRCDTLPVAWWFFTGVGAAAVTALSWHSPEPAARGTPISSP